jgi:hypothetical protein
MRTLTVTIMTHVLLIVAILSSDVLTLLLFVLTKMNVALLHVIQIMDANPILLAAMIMMLVQLMDVTLQLDVLTTVLNVMTLILVPMILVILKLVAILNKLSALKKILVLLSTAAIIKDVFMKT